MLVSQRAISVIAGCDKPKKWVRAERKQEERVDRVFGEI